MVFIGHTSPSAVQSSVICGIKRIIDRCDGAVNIINTDGWILDPAAALYKSKLISTIKPDIVIGIGSRTELQPIIDISRAKWMTVEPSHVVLQRSRNDRRVIRNFGYRRFLQGSYVHTVSLKHMNMRIRTSLREPLSQQSSDLDNLIIGLLDGEGFMLHVGILMRIEDECLKVFTRSIQGVKGFEIGYVKISTAGSELGYFE
jgi:polynucleotide 5'-kinase involved in rRNA processing